MTSPTETYIDHCLKEGRIVRWPEKTMPIRVHIAPFRWYEKSKQQESHAYNGMVLQAMEQWSRISGGKVTFRVVNTLNESQIDVNWRRVDRTSLGHCEYLVNKNHQIYSAEIKIGISDGIIHAKYNDIDEVNHTIVHEFGHALGILGHSTHNHDIMYVPHQFGVVSVSPRDEATLRWLYRLPVGFSWEAYAHRHQLPKGTTVHDVLNHIDGKPLTTAKTISKTTPKIVVKENPKVLEHHHAILTQMGKFHLSTQNIMRPSSQKERVDQTPQPEPE